jgi:hypothetical protein
MIGEDGKQKHDYQADGLSQLPMGFLFLFWLSDFGVLRYHNDNQHKKDVYDQQVPIVEKDLSHHAKRHLVGMAQELDEIDGEVFPEEVETDDVHEIQQDDESIANDIQEVDDTLKPLIVNDARGKTIENEAGDIDAEDNGQVEPHAIEIQRRRLSDFQLVEKINVEHIEHPAADAQGHKGGEQPVEQQHVWHRKPFLEFLFSGLTAHYFVLIGLQK